MFRHFSKVAAVLAGTMMTAGMVAADDFDKAAALETVRVLSADDMNGRKATTPGGEKARAWLLDRIAKLDVDPVGGKYEHSFDVMKLSRRKITDEVLGQGTNLLFSIEGSESKDMIVVSAHYDHVGARGDNIYNGADDNASGVAGLFAVAEYFLKHKPKHTIVFALFDAEEMRLQGAAHFVKHLEHFDNKVVFNINMDMISHSQKNELYVAGLHHREYLTPLVDEIEKASTVKLLRGHDKPELGPGDWTFSSDHAPFHRADVPFLYFGVEDHPHYHKPTDTFENVPQDFFLRAVETIVRSAAIVDSRLGKLPGK